MPGGLTGQDGWVCFTFLAGFACFSPLSQEMPEIHKNLTHRGPVRHNSHTTMGVTWEDEKPVSVGVRTLGSGSHGTQRASTLR